MLRISICPGIGKDADTAPKALAAPTGGGRAFQAKAQPFAGGAATTTNPFGGQTAFAQPIATAHAATHTNNPFLVQQQQAAQTAFTQPIAQPAPPPPVPQANAQPRCKALYAHNGQTATELSFQAGDIITILKKDAGGWWEGELNGKRGWIPHNYVQEI